MRRISPLRVGRTALLLLGAWLAGTVALPPLASSQTVPATAESRLAMSDGGLAKRVERWVREIQPSADERRFDGIGWLTKILEAERLARQHGRPVFLFTHAGRMAQGRC